MKKTKDINFNIERLKVSLNFVEKKFKRYYFLLDNIPSDKINQIFVRNLYYFFVIIEKIKLNLREINVSKRILKNKDLSKDAKSKIKLGIRRKSIVSMVLLEHLVALMQKYKIDTFDFEIQSLIDKDENISLKKVPEKFKDVVREEFDSIRYDYNITADYQINSEGKVIEPLRGLIRKIRRGLNKVKYVGVSYLFRKKSGKDFVFPVQSLGEFGRVMSYQSNLIPETTHLGISPKRAYIPTEYNPGIKKLFSLILQRIKQKIFR